MRTQYRFYSLTNLYISDIQRGIQTAHAVSEMMSKYREPERVGANDAATTEIYTEWAEKDKTIIVLQGGPSGALHEAHEFIKIKAHRLTLPFVKFYEDEYSLNGALTAVGVVVPDYVYQYGNEDAMSRIGKELTWAEQTSAQVLQKYLSGFKLA